MKHISQFLESYALCSYEIVNHAKSDAGASTKASSYCVWALAVSLPPTESRDWYNDSLLSLCWSLSVEVWGKGVAFPFIWRMKPIIAVLIPHSLDCVVGVYTTCCRESWILSAVWYIAITILGSYRCCWSWDSYTWIILSEWFRVDWTNWSSASESALAVI